MRVVQRSEECRRERAEALKGQVRRKLLKATSRISSVAEMVVLVDTLERLGIDNHFRHEIAAMLHRVHSEEHGGGGGAAGSDVADDDLHVTSLRFRLLRQHGLGISAGTS